MVTNSLQYTIVDEGSNSPFNSHLTEEYINSYCSTRDVFVETGTYLGDTVRLAKHCGFKMIHSIELDEELCKRATDMFKDDPSITIWHGDSVDCLPSILQTFTGPATFWLDAHASGEFPGGRTGGSPVIDELKIIQGHVNHDHTIFIDDRRLFESAEWSGVKEEDAIALLRDMNPKYAIKLLNGHVPLDVICASPWNTNS